jgi:hypothetical protein
MADARQKNQAKIPGESIVDGMGTGGGEFSPTAIMNAVPGHLVSTTGVPHKVPKEALDALKEDVRAAERAGTTAPGAALSLAAWRQAGEASRWALDFERRHGMPPELSDYMARAMKRVPPSSLSSMAAESRAASQALSGGNHETRGGGQRAGHARGAPEAMEQGGGAI